MTTKKIDGELVLICDTKDCPGKQGFSSSDLAFTLKSAEEAGWVRVLIIGIDHSDYCPICAKKLRTDK